MAFRIKDLMISVVPRSDVEVNKQITIVIGKDGDCGATGCGSTDCAGGIDCGASGCGSTSCAGASDCGASGCGSTSCAGASDCGASGCGSTSCAGASDCGASGCGSTSCAGASDCGASGCGSTSCVGASGCGASGCGTTDVAGGCVASIDERTIFTHDQGELVQLQAELRRLLEATHIQERAIAERRALSVSESAQSPEDLAALESRLQEALAEVRARRAEQ